MACLRCGNKTEEYAAFCLECQKNMARHPVDFDAVVQIPVRSRTAAKKSVRRKITPEEQIRFLNRRVHICFAAFLVALTLAICFAIPLFSHFMSDTSQIGQNYSIVKTTTAPTEAG